MGFLIDFWYSRFRTPVLVLLVLICAAPIGYGATRNGAERPPSTTTPAPQTTVPLEITWSFAPLAEQLRIPGGAGNPVMLKQLLPEHVAALAEALDADVEKTSKSWTGDGLTIEETGGWTYKNPAVSDPAAATGCKPGAICLNPKASLPPPVSDLPSENDAMDLAREIHSIGGVEVSLLDARRDQWRAVIDLHLRKDGIGIGSFGRTVFGPGGAVIEASGAIGEYEVMYSSGFELPSAEDGLERLVASGSLLLDGARTPNTGEVVQIENVFRTMWIAPGTTAPSPILAFQDTDGNVWGLTVNSPPVDIDAIVDEWDSMTTTTTASSAPDSETGVPEETSTITDGETLVGSTPAASSQPPGP